jgi:hypothetical protein
MRMNFLVRFVYDEITPPSDAATGARLAQSNEATPPFNCVSYAGSRMHISFDIIFMTPHKKVCLPILSHVIIIG